MYKLSEIHMFFNSTKHGIKSDYLRHNEPIHVYLSIINIIYRPIIIYVIIYVILFGIMNQFMFTSLLFILLVMTNRR